jgi:hypothetical protein
VPHFPFFAALWQPLATTNLRKAGLAKVAPASYLGVMNVLPEAF